MVKLEMMVAGMPYFGTDHEQANYAEIAKGVGIKSFRIEDPDDLEPVLKEALAYDGPVLVDIVTDPNALSLPPGITWDMMKGFTKSGARTAFLEGGVGRLFNLAKSNLRHIGGAAAIEFGG